MTPEELRITEILADAFIAYAQLDRYHPSEMDEFTQAIHVAQRIVMARLAVREHPDVFHRSTA